MSDYIEFGDTGLTVLPNGNYYNKVTKETITPDGKTYSESGELIYDPEDDDDPNLS